MTKQTKLKERFLLYSYCYQFDNIETIKKANNIDKSVLFALSKK